MTVSVETTEYPVKPMFLFYFFVLYIWNNKSRNKKMRFSEHIHMFRMVMMRGLSHQFLDFSRICNFCIQAFFRLSAWFFSVGEIF